MSDQKEIETSRYARKTVTVRGLLQGTHDPNAKKIMAEHGIMWDLTGKTNNLEELTFKATTNFVEGEELPSGLTTAEADWILALAEKHGLEVGIVEKEQSAVPDVPYMGVPIRFSHGTAADGSTIWSDLQLKVNGADATVELNRSSRLLTLKIEGQRKDDVASHQIDVWVQRVVKKVRDALKAAGFTEGDLDIDCEVIMGAEREAQCDPELMRSLLTGKEEREEE
tara:strand:- start:11524 stop:12198 length:675 start_codon:yes stop_codon:yes gene_type:complete